MASGRFQVLGTAGSLRRASFSTKPARRAIRVWATR
jgi:hypothetical protein